MGAQAVGAAARAGAGPAGGLDALLAAERARVRGALAAAVALAAAAAALALAAAAGGVLGGGRWLALPALAPVFAWVAIGGVAVGVVVGARRRAARRAAADAVARAVERERALRDGALRAAREVAATGPLGARASDALAARLRAAAGDAPLAPAWLGEARGAAGRAGAACAAGAVALGAAGTLAGDGVRALAHPIDAARGTLLPALRVTGAPPRVARGRPLTITVEAPGRRRVAVRVRQAGGGWTERAVAVGPDGRAPLALGRVDADLALVVGDGRTLSDTVRVAVDERAFLGDVAVRAEFPAYLGRAPESLPAGDVLRVPRGTALAVEARASAALARAALVGPGGAVPLGAGDGAGGRVGARFVPAASGRWAWEAADARGPADVPAPLDVVVLADSAPVATIVRPSADSTVDGLAALPVRVRASDDHGLARVALRVVVERAGGAREAPRVTALGGAGGPAWEGAAEVRPQAFALAPGDRVRVQAVATDASPWAQTGASRELVLRVPGAAELRAAARRGADSAIAAAAGAAAAARSLAERTGDAARARAFSGPSGAGHQAAERARSLAAEQRQLGARVEELRQQAAALERRLQQSGALDPSLARQLAEVQQLLRDALTPELARQLADVERAAGQQGPGGTMQQSLEQLAARQRALREQLEQSGEMLKRAALEGAMQTLRDDARELAAAQDRAAQRLAGQRPAPAADAGPREDGARDPGAETPRALAERSRALAADVSALGERLARAQAEAGAQRAGAAARDAARSAAAMTRAAGPERGGDPGGRRSQGDAADAAPAPRASNEAGAPNGASSPGAPDQAARDAGATGAPDPGRARSAREAAGAMRQAADQLAEARRQQVEDWKRDIGDALDRAAQETQQLAREQQQLARDARAGRDPASLRAAQAAVQQGAEQAARRVEQAGRKSSLLSQRARRAMAEARQELTDAGRALQPNAAARPGGGQPGGASGESSSGSGGRTPGDAASEMGEAGDALSRAAAALVRDRERVRGAASSTGFEEMVAQMRQLAGQQGQINEQAAGLPMPSPGAAGQPGRSAARKLARQQRGVAERLGELGDADPSGRSDALAREARQLAQALERRAASDAPAPDPATLARQQQLYRKMLEAGRSLEQDERDEQGKREARAGGAVAGVAPATGVEAGRAATRYAPPAWGDLRGLSAEERRLVTEYFRRLNGGAGASP